MKRIQHANQRDKLLVVVEEVERVCNEDIRLIGKLNTGGGWYCLIQRYTLQIQ